MITTEQIEALQVEAGEHGDTDMVAACQRALEGDAVAVALCERAIASARAMQD